MASLEHQDKHQTLLLPNQALRVFPLTKKKGENVRLKKRRIEHQLTHQEPVHKFKVADDALKLNRFGRRSEGKGGYIDWTSGARYTSRWLTGATVLSASSLSGNNK